MRGAVVHEGDEALIVGDEVGEGGPAGEGDVGRGFIIGEEGGSVGVWFYAAGVVGVVEGCHGDVVVGCEEEGYHFLGVRV